MGDQPPADAAGTPIGEIEGIRRFAPAVGVASMRTFLIAGSPEAYRPPQHREALGQGSRLVERRTPAGTDIGRFHL